MMKRLSTLCPWMAMSAMLTVTACGNSSGTSLQALTPEGDDPSDTHGANPGRADGTTASSAECEELRKAIERPDATICPDPNDRQGCEEKLRELVEKYAADCAPGDVGQDIPPDKFRHCCACADTACRQECADIPPELLKGCVELPPPPPEAEPVECILMRHAVDVCFLTGTCEARCFILVDAMREACDRPELCAAAGCRCRPLDEPGPRPCDPAPPADGTACGCSASGSGPEEGQCGSTYDPRAPNTGSGCVDGRDDGTSPGGR